VIVRGTLKTFGPIGFSSQGELVQTGIRADIELDTGLAITVTAKTLAELEARLTPEENPPQPTPVSRDEEIKDPILLEE